MGMTKGVASRIPSWVALSLTVWLAGPGCIDGHPASVELASEQGELLRNAAVFDHKTFGGNGRTCRTCHAPSTAFTLSPEDVRVRLDANPRDALFQQDATDDGMGTGLERLISDATILITRRLPSHIVIEGDPQTRSITVPRGVPSLLDLGVQELQSRQVFTADGLFTSLEDQALGAVREHYEPRGFPTPEQLERLALFQTSDAFFSSPELAALAVGGPDVDLPEGNTESERRGREFFVASPQPDPESGEPRHLTCASCHSGPLLNEVRFSPGPVANGHRFMDVFVSTLRAREERLMDLVVTHNDATACPPSSAGVPGLCVNTLTTADPGQLLVEGSFRCQPCTANRVGFVTCGGCIPCSNFVEFNPYLAGRENNVCALLPGRFPNGTLRPAPTGNVFKIPSLRGISRTAPYFHDNSAATLEEVIAHYQDFFEIQFRRTEAALPDAEEPLDGRLSPQDIVDIIAFMRLL
jgi:hypothetical protein